jgi:phosphoribosylformimino-5-aminoimidazole carboxamide ribotide isomerase
VTAFDLYPAIDLRGGRCVRLLRGEYDAETVYGADPAAVAGGFIAEGARWIHIVDLDAARTGEPANRAAIAAVARVANEAGVAVQAGGGVRSVGAAQALWRSGVQRVVVGTAAVEEPDLVQRLVDLGEGEVAVGLDVRGREVAIRGWEQGSGTDLATMLDRVGGAGAVAFVITQIARDGTLEGPDLVGLSEALAVTAVPVIASGGVGRLDDIEALAQVRVDGRRLAGVICGKAIYEGRFGVGDALATVASASRGRHRNQARP